MYSPCNESYTDCLTLGLIVVPVVGLGVAILTDVPDWLVAAFVLTGLIACVLAIRRDCIWNTRVCDAEGEMKQWWRALRDYAAAHEGRFPPSDQLPSILAAELPPGCQYNLPVPTSSDDFILLTWRAMPNLTLDLQLNGAVRRRRYHAPVGLPS